jgi:hypothetical protein
VAIVLKNVKDFYWETVAVLLRIGRPLKDL